MEPTETEVIVWRTTVETVDEAVNKTDVWQAWILKLSGIPLAMYLKDHPNLAPGDRVKITITKEPTP